MGYVFRMLSLGMHRLRDMHKKVKSSKQLVAFEEM